MARIDRVAVFDDFAPLRAIADAAGMECLDSSADVQGIDLTLRLVSEPFTAELVYLLFEADPGEHDRVTIHLVLLRDDDVVDVVEFEELRGAVRA